MKKIPAFLIMISACYWQPLVAATFTTEPLSTAQQQILIKDQFWHEGCPVPLSRLNSLTLSYYDFTGHEQLGHLIVLDAAAPYFLNAFKKMYAMHYPLESVGAGDPQSYAETSTFNCRAIRGEANYSIHAYGLAIDINVSRNPYIGEFQQSSDGIIGQLIPATKTSYAYLNRAVQRPGMNEQIVKIMADSGFIVWGGQWQDRVDYQHFQVPDNIAINMAYLDKKSAEEFMQLVVNYPDSAKKMSADTKWKYLYQLYPNHYIQALTQYFPLLNTEDENKVFNLVNEELTGNN